MKEQYSIEEILKAVGDLQSLRKVEHEFQFFIHKQIVMIAYHLLSLVLNRFAES